MLLRKLAPFALGLLAIAALLSCSGKKSYADLLNDETKAINTFLADNYVELNIPADSVFQQGYDAPFYRIDPDGNVFMQVIEPGDGTKIKDDAQVYFRFTRYNLSEYATTGTLGAGAGNSEDLGMGSCSFRFNNYSLTTSSNWGSGIQLPINFVGYNSHVRIVVKSQYGLTSEISQVIPYLYDIRYLPAVSD